MRFLLKAAFWLGAVFLFMPKLSGDDPKPPSADKILDTKSQNSHIGSFFDSGMIEKWQQAGKSLQDIQRLCAENPVLCEAGKAFLLQSDALTTITKQENSIRSLNSDNIAKPKQNPEFKVPLPVPAPR